MDKLRKTLKDLETLSEEQGITIEESHSKDGTDFNDTNSEKSGSSSNPDLDGPTTTLNHTRPIRRSYNRSRSFSSIAPTLLPLPLQAPSNFTGTYAQFPPRQGLRLNVPDELSELSYTPRDTPRGGEDGFPDNIVYSPRPSPSPYPPILDDRIVTQSPSTLLLTDILAKTHLQTTSQSIKKSKSYDGSVFLPIQDSSSSQYSHHSAKSLNKIDEDILSAEVCYIYYYYLFLKFVNCKLVFSKCSLFQ